MKKMKNMLEGLQLQQTEMVEKELPEVPEWFHNPPKISKGENYEGLPYLVLDYPRRHREQELFFIRSMFWWGNFFSSTLHLSGRYKNQFNDHIIQAYHLLGNHYAGINKDPWQHHFEASNYTRIGELSKKEFEVLTSQHTHLKIAIHWPLDQWPGTQDQLFENWKLYLKICGLIP